jgi:hypothetical protein
MECKLLDLGMVAHPNGLDLNTSDSSMYQYFLQMLAFYFCYKLVVQVEKVSVNLTQSLAFCSCLLGFRRCSFLKAHLMTAPAPSQSPVPNQMHGLSYMEHEDNGEQVSSISHSSTHIYNGDLLLQSRENTQSNK